MFAVSPRDNISGSEAGKGEDPAFVPAMFVEKVRCWLRARSLLLFVAGGWLILALLRKSKSYQHVGSLSKPLGCQQSQLREVLE